MPNRWPNESEGIANFLSWRIDQERKTSSALVGAWIIGDYICRHEESFSRDRLISSVEAETEFFGRSSPLKAGEAVGLALQQKFIVKSRDGDYIREPKNCERIEEARRSVDEFRKGFREAFINRFRLTTASRILGEENWDAITDISEELVQGYLTTRAFEISDGLHSQLESGSVSYVQLIRSDFDMSSNLKILIGDRFGQDVAENLGLDIERGIRSAFTGAGLESESYLANLHYRAYCEFLAGWHPQMVAMLADSIGNSIALLDTNVFVAYSNVSHPEHQPAKEVIESYKSNGARVGITTESWDEYIHLLRRKAHRERQELDALPGVKDWTDIKDDLEIRRRLTFGSEYYRLRYLNEGFIWSSYMQERNGPHYAAMMGIEIVTQHRELALADPNVSILADAMAQIRGVEPTTRELRDARNICWTTAFRNSGNNELSLGRTAVFITMDQSLYQAQSAIINRDDPDYRVCIRLTDAMELLAPLQSMNSPLAQALPTYVLKSRLGLTQLDTRVAEAVNYVLPHPAFNLESLLKGQPEIQYALANALAGRADIERLFSAAEDGIPQDDLTEF